MDARRLNSEEQYNLRQRIVELWRDKRTFKDISNELKVSDRHVRNVCQKYSEKREDGIKLGKRGRRLGVILRLDEKQEKKTKRILENKTPKQLGLPLAVWTRDAVRLMIKQKVGADLPLRTITDYLKHWYFVFPRPIKVNGNQNLQSIYKKPEKAAEQTHDRDTITYQQILARVKKEEAEIHWGSEIGAFVDYYNAYMAYMAKKKCFTEQEYGSMRFPLEKKIVNMISAVANRGKVRFMLYKRKMPSDMFIKFMARLVKDIPCKIFLIICTAHLHHGADVKAWLMTYEKKIEVFYLPPESLRLFPRTYRNKDLEQAIRSCDIPLNIEKGIDKYVREILKGKPERIGT